MPAISRLPLALALLSLALPAAPASAAGPEVAAAPRAAPAPAPPTPRAAAAPRPAPAPAAPARPLVPLLARAPLAMPEAAMAFVASRVYLGVSLLDVTPELRAHYGAAEDAGVLVGRVEKGSPADHAGIEVGDLLIAVDGEDVAAPWDLTRRLASHEPGARVRVDLLRDGRRQTVEAELAARPGGGRDVLKLVAPGAPAAELGAPQCAELGRRLGECLDANLPGDLALRLRTRRGELETRVEDLEKRLRELQAKLDRLDGERR